MIVNPAYAYMRKKEIVPDFPFWENGELNVSTTGSQGFVFYASDNEARIGYGKAVFTVDSTKYSKLKFNAYSSGTITVRVYAQEGGKEYGTTNYTLGTTETDYEFIIPSGFQKNNAQFVFSSPNGYMILNSIILTN